MRMRTLISALAVVITAVVMAAGSFTAPANAATMHAWSRIAKCESGGRWHINTHNGYYGGLQISSGTWRAFGGKRYARDAHTASKNQQVKVATRIQKRQGWGAWPTCARRAGLR